MTAGSLTFTKQSENRGPVRPVSLFTLAWTSDASGNVTGLTTTVPIGGEVLRVVFVPSSGGTAPTNNYAMTLKDSSGLDILSGQGAALSNTTTTEICPSVPMKDGTTTSTRPRAIDDTLTLAVVNAGNAKSGTVLLYVR